VFNRALVLGLFALLPIRDLAAEDLPLLDPTRPFQQAQTPAEQGSASHRLELTAVLISAQRRIAVINGKFYREGELVAGARITRIGPESVGLRRGSEDSEVRLNNGRIGSQTISRGVSAP
jgi:MSHA biogenesis protein MshK